MPRIKVTRCILVFTIISLLAFLSLSLWMDSSRRSKSDEEYINLLFKSPTSSNHLPLNITQRSSNGRSPKLKRSGENSNTKNTTPSQMTLLTPAEVQKFWSSFTSVKPWFMKDGQVRPDQNNLLYQSLPLWPDQDFETDRITNQLMYIPSNYNEMKDSGKLKKIFLFHGRSERATLGLPLGQAKFIMDKCPVNTCEITIDPLEMEDADAILFKVKNYFSRTSN